MAHAAGLLLAAGAGRRLGLPKALLRLDNHLLVERAIAVLAEGGCAPVTVVLGAMADRVQAEADLSRAMIVVNPRWHEGMGSSLIAGLRALTQTGAQAALVMLVDLPGLTASAVERVAALSAPDVLAAATYHGKRGHPVLLGRSHWDAICAGAVGDSGARDYLRVHDVNLVACEDIASPAEIDTPEDAVTWGLKVDGA